MNMKQWLKDQQSQYDAQAAEAKANPGGNFENPPDGKYVTLLLSAELCMSKSSNRPQVAWEYKIVEGPLTGKTFKKFDGMDNPRSFEFLARKVMLWGFDPTTISLVTLQDKVLDKIVDMGNYLRVTLKTNDDFQNCYINKVLEDYIPDQSLASRQSADQEYNPFNDDHLEAKPGMKVFYKNAPEDEDEIEGVIVEVKEESLVVKAGKKTVEVAALRVVRVEAAEEPATT